MARPNELNPGTEVSCRIPLVLQTTGEEASEEIRHIKTLCKRIVKEKETLSHELSELQERIKAKEEAIAVLTVERDQFRNAFTQQAMQIQLGTQVLDCPRRTTRIDDPAILTDGKNPKFEDWLLYMEDKLSANADHYSTPTLRLAYVRSRCGGRAIEHLLARSRPTSVNPYRDASEIFDHLKTIYQDVNRAWNAKGKLRRLYMRASDKFQDFVSEFCYLAQESGLAESEWKEELYHKLHVNLQRLVIPEVNDSDLSFNEFTVICTKIVGRWEQIALNTQRLKGPVWNSSPTSSRDRFEPSSGRGSSCIPAVATAIMPYPQISSERAQLMKEGKCFYCKEPGHLAINCLVKQRTSELKVMKPKDKPLEVVNPESTKQKHVAKVSYLGEVYEFSLEGFDLRHLLGGQSFTVPVQIAFNGSSVPISSLADSGATGYVFLNSRCALEAAKSLKAPLLPLSSPCDIKGYDGKTGVPITHAIFLHLWVDGRKFLKVPMLITELGKHDMIIGKNWLAEHDVWLDMKNQKLIWPEQRTLEAGAQEQANVVPREILHHYNSNPEQDTNQQDQWQVNPKISTKLEREPDRPWSKSQAPQLRYRPPRTEAADRRHSLAKMTRELHRKDTLPLPTTVKKVAPISSSVQLDIAVIGAVPFHRQSKREGTEVFVTSLHEIEAEIKDQRDQNLRQEWDDDEQEILEVLPKEYHEFRDVFSKKASDQLPPSRECDHRIELEEGKVVAQEVGYSPLRKHTLEELEAVKKYITENLAKGFIVPGGAPFASPILMARKNDGGLRFCVDYRRLNAITKKDRYPLPLIDELLERLSRARIFTKLDIRQGFHRIRMNPDSEDLTTFRTRYGSYKYKVMPFGLTNGPATFQRFVNGIFMKSLDDFLTAFIDDLLIYSSNLKEHRKHVRIVLQRLREAGLQASIRKCEFHVTETKYLGFIITSEGIKVDPEKVATIINWRRPCTVRAVQSFLGFCNFYRRFIRNYSKIARSLYHLTKDNVPFSWNADCARAFQELKNFLSNAPILRHYQADRPTKVETDASDGVVAGVLSQQQDDGLWHPIGFYSKSMSAPEKNYEIHDKEMLAVVRALEEWRPELEGLQRQDRFDIFTDHKALEYFMTTKKLNARQARWADFLSRFHFRIRYRPGKENTLADALSRPETSTSRNDHRMQTLLKPEMVEEPLKALESVGQLELLPVEPAIPVVDEIQAANRSSQSLTKFRKEAAENPESPWKCDDGLLTHRDRLVVPNDDPSLRARLLDEIHRQPSTAHPGRNKTRRLVSGRYYWKGWGKDVDRYIRNCVKCRRAENPRDKTPGLLKPLPIPHHPWQHIAMDFRSFPRDKAGYDAAFVVVDRLSKQPITIPCYKTTTAEEMAQLFIDHVYRHHGAPETIVSDRGGQFISAFWKEFCGILGTKLKLSTAHHAPTDGQTEIINQHIIMRLRPLVNYYQDNWSRFCPMIDHAAGALIQESVGLSPFFINHGREPRLSFDWRPITIDITRDIRMERESAQQLARHMENIWKLARENMATAQSRQEIQANKHRREPDFNVGDDVWLLLKDYRTGRPNKKLDDQMAGKFRILEKVGNSYRLDLPPSMRIHPIFSPDKLRKAANDPLPGQQEDPVEPVEINGEKEWEVEQVLASRIYRGRLQYRVKWKGYDDDPQWYPARNFKGSPHAVRNFHSQNPEKPGPPLRLQQWLDAWNEDEELTDLEEDDRPGDRPFSTGG
jgi:transposase InsO family protein